MNFAAEPVMDAITPPRAAARPHAPQSEAGPTFDEHLDATSPPTSENEQAARAADPKANAQAEVEPEAPPQTEQTDATTALAAAIVSPAPAPPVAAPVVVQIAASTPARQVQQQPETQHVAPLTAPAAPAAASAPVQPGPQQMTANTDPTPAIPTQEKSAAAENKTAPTNPPVQTASQQPNATPMATAAPIPVQITTPQASSTPQLIAPALQAVAATVAPAQAPSQPLIVARPTKDGIDTTQTRATAEAVIRRETPQTAASLAGKTQLNKAAGEQGGAKDTATPVSAPSVTPEAAPPTQITSTAATTTQATHVQNAAIDASAQRAAPAAAQVAREIVRRFDGGATSFELRLDPPELGRVEVRMEVSRDHRVTAVIAADTPQALTELARHARDLEQQLQSAGLELSDQGLSFDLRQGATGGETEDAGNAAHARSGEEATAEPAQPTARPIGFERWRGVRVDMMV